METITEKPDLGQIAEALYENLRRAHALANVAALHDDLTELEPEVLRNYFWSIEEQLNLALEKNDALLMLIFPGNKLVKKS